MFDLVREDVAVNLRLPLEDVAFRKAASFSWHICINGTAYCGRINNDGYNVPTQAEEIFLSGTCKTCVNRYANMLD
jgi:hypothetical protein